MKEERGKLKKKKKGRGSERIMSETKRNKYSNKRKGIKRGDERKRRKNLEREDDKIGRTKRNGVI